MSQLLKDDKDARAWHDDEPRNCWARAHFDTTSKCEHLTNNFTKSIGGF